MPKQRIDEREKNLELPLSDEELRVFDFLLSEALTFPEFMAVGGPHLLKSLDRPDKTNDENA